MVNYNPMGKSKADEGGGKSNKDGKKEKLSVSAILASMDKKPDASKPKPKATPKVQSPYADIDLPPSDDDDDADYLSSEEGDGGIKRKERASHKNLEMSSMTDKKIKKREKKDRHVAQAVDRANQEAQKDDPDAFSIVIGRRASVLDGQEDADANVKDITVDNFSVSVRGRDLLKNTNVKISHGRRYSLVGPNGTGKSTLLKLLAWRKIPVPKNIDVLLVEQEVVGDDHTTVLEAIVSANEELAMLKQEVASLLEIPEGVENGADTGEKLAELYDKLQIMGADATEAQASKILAGLGFTKVKQGLTTKSFSGGWRMRIALARALFVQPTLLLLDEPTNHLDLRAVIWLQEYLLRWKKTLIVVSHDRDFLNSVFSEIIHLHDLKLHTYRGNFDDFECGYEQCRKEMNKKFEIYEKQLKAAKRAGNQKQQEKVKEKAIFEVKKAKEKVEEDDEFPEAPQKWTDYTVKFHFPEPTELTPPLLQLIDVSCRYLEGEKFGLSDVDVGIDMGTRVAIVGPNGAGKSTLLNLFDPKKDEVTEDKCVVTKGEVRRSPKLRIRRYSQHFVDSLTMDETPVQYLLRLYPDQEGMSKKEAVQVMLGKFGLPSPNHIIPITDLSGGQKARVVFASISMSKLHILLLDEPTNHLDMESIDALADALDEFTGGVVLVSHDSRLILRVCADEEKSQIWEVDNGLVKKFEGTFKEYKERLWKEIKAEVDD